jgi:ATP-binding cassette, subfamily B, bacterial
MSFPNYIQYDMMDCGAVCLQIISKYYGRFLSQQRLRELCHITHNGVSLLGISDAAEAVGFRTVGVKITWDQLKNDATLPCIVHWNQDHFIVVYKIIKNKDDVKVCVSDPCEGLLKYPIHSFLKSWLQIKNDNMREYEERGVALLLAPKPDFYNEEEDSEKNISLWKLINYLKPYRNYIVQVLFAMLSGSIISLILPFLTQTMVDTGINTGNISFVVMILIAQMFLVVGQMTNNVIRSWLMLHITTRVSISLISDFLAKLMRLPIAFFDSKHTGDILQRIHDYDRIQSFLTGALISTIMAIITFIIYGFVMSSYKSSILVVFIIGSIFYLGWIQIFMKRRRKLNYMQFQEASTNQSNLIQLVNGMQEIKLNNCERQRRWEWEHIQAKLFKISTRSLTLGQTQDIGGALIDQTKNIVISFISAKAVINGNITIGAMVALQYIIGQLNAPLNQFVTFMQSLQDAKISMERMSEINEKEDEENYNDNKIHEIPQNADINLYNVSYQYDGPRSFKVIDNLTLKIPANKVTAIVGASGSGKTTLLKILLGFYQPCEGEIRINNTPFENYSIGQWRKNCGVVMQDGFIFYNTIANNISLSDERPNIERIHEAAKIGNIDTFIESLPMRYNTKIGVEGHGLSSGQKQRILIARAIYKNAKYIIFDEATNSLDANNERKIIEQLDSFFNNKTVVIVAHRLSTVKNAHNIVVLENGRIVEQGTHEHLITIKGAYYKLVKNQLELGN